MIIVRGLSQIWGFVDKRAADLLEIETDPRKTTEMLTDWERNWGLPEPCFAEPQTIEDRRRILVLKMTFKGEQDRAFFIAVARYMGYRIQIREYAPFMCGVSRVGDTRGYDSDDDVHFRWYIGPPENRFYWTVWPDFVRLSWFRAGSGQCGVDPHLRIGIATDLECVLRKWKPAQTEIIFDYSGVENGGPFAGIDVNNDFWWWQMHSAPESRPMNISTFEPIVTVG
jgi:uncharacterized protein YmfQ (DUF2313 family)